MFFNDILKIILNVIYEYDPADNSQQSKFIISCRSRYFVLIAIIDIFDVFPRVIYVTID